MKETSPKKGGPSKKKQSTPRGSPRATGTVSSDWPTSPVSQKGSLQTSRPWVREDDFADCFYASHTVVGLLGVVLIILGLWRYYYYPSTIESNVKLGLYAACFTFIAFGSLHLPDSIMVRPHPAVWRAVLSSAVLYVLLLTFLLFQDLPTIRRILAFYDPSLAQPMAERTYAEDCRITSADNPWLFLENCDAFIAAHALGYMVKALILRDGRMVTAVSLGFEIIEVSFQHILPNFRECWWDHLLLDVLICNAGGTLLGLWMLRLLRAKKYEWIALKEIKTVKGKAHRVLGQLGPRSFAVYHWDMFQTPRRFMQVCGVLVMVLLQELNCFTMKFILNVPATHPLVTMRLGLWALLAMSGLREYYEFMSTTRGSAQHIGTTAWISTLGLVVETLWIAKMALEGQYFNVPFPTYIALPGLAAVAFLAIWFFAFFFVLTEEVRRRKQGWKYHGVNLFFYASGASLLALFLMGMPDLQIGRRWFEDNIDHMWKNHFA